MSSLFIGDWFRELTTPLQIFWGISLMFSVLFVIQFVVSLFGFDFDADVEADTGGDVGTSLDADFNAFSVRSIIAFFTFFGWTGVLLLNAGKSITTVLIGSGISGLAALLLVAYMLYLFSKFNQSGTIDLEQTLFEKGEVYLKIPPAKNGMGKVHIKIGNNIKELRAITEGASIPTGSRIRVIEVLDDNLLLVEPLDQLQH